MSAKNSFRNRTTPTQPAAWRGWLLFGAAVVATFALGVLAASILQRREEAKAGLPLEPIAEYETDSSKWAVNWPRQYDSYRGGEESSSETKFGGAYPRDLLAETPANVILFAGYGFAKEYRQARGHLHTIEDVVNTTRLTPTTAATCWTCKSPDVVRLMADMGPAEFYKQTFDSFKG
ncbi:MAG: ammonia-forming cytochrome c nitrite reductase subunit c552, partial [Pirellulaceae bacterium]|nr:ammonia-forming cytochrome c nitrite reductase subunit c552 [Pirellulaceae bacterium]